MKILSIYFVFAFLNLVILGSVMSCQTNENQKEERPKQAKELRFESSVIADSVELLWAHCPADVTGDGIVDLVFVNNNGSGGYLGFFKGQTAEGLWKKEVIAQTAPGGGTFAQGDLECADIDFDGDIDIVAAEHPGEWDKSDTTSVLYWFENPGWKAHRIGETPAFIKDISLVDFNNDKKMDLAALTFEANTLSVFQQEASDNWTKVQYFESFGNLHEGMATGDLNGDGLEDIVANAHIFYNPGADLTAEWQTENLDNKWNSQTGDWSRNGTKAFLQDLNNDGKTEIFISHSERGGYPLSWYQKDKNEQWNENIISDSIPACHTLQVFDFDQDGDYDVLVGINSSRAVNLGFDKFTTIIFLSSENHSSWTPQIVREESIYNGQATDFEGDGDIDIFRYRTHDATKFHLYKNRLINHQED